MVAAAGLVEGGEFLARTAQGVYDAEGGRGGGQRTGDGGQRTEDRGRRAEDRGQRTEDGGRRAEDRGRRTEDRRQRAELCWITRRAGNRSGGSGDFQAEGYREGKWVHSQYGDSGSMGAVIEPV